MLPIKMLDTVRKFETPEGVDLELHVAGPVVRALAYIIDGLIKFTLYVIIAIVLKWFGKSGTALALIIVFCMVWLYPVIFEVLQGATPGKKMMDLSVCHDDGTPISLTSSLLRNLLRVADFYPFAYFTGLIAMLLNKDFKRLGDMVAGTVVVYAYQDNKDYLIPELEPLVLPSPLLIGEKRAILDFAERSDQFPKGRQIELADLLTEYSGASKETGLGKVFRYANWLTRGKSE